MATQGHTIRLMSPEYVKPYVKAQKNDDRDAEAIAEAATRPTMRFVTLKDEAQLDLQTLHRVRERLVASRTSLTNQLRAILLERGLTFPKGRKTLMRRLDGMSAEQNTLSDRVKRLVSDLRAECEEVEGRIRALNDELAEVARRDGRPLYEARAARISILAGGSPETGYVDADRYFTLADGAGHTFFEQVVFQPCLGQCLLQLPRLGTQRLDLVRRCLARRVARQPLLAGLQELLRPAVIHALRDAPCGTARQCWSHPASPRARCGSSPRPSTAGALPGGYL
jgi:hypothetical protein